MSETKNPGDLYYYCMGCKKFHEIGSFDEKGVNRRLCFVCWKKGKKKTRIMHREGGSLQVCVKCQEEYDWTGWK